MLLLAIDTSGKQGSIALAKGRSSGDEASDVEIVEVVALTGGTFSAQLVPQIAELLASHDFTKNDVDAFAVVAGPGSFTGLRIGLAVVKAMAEVLGKPIAAVSLLEACAVTSACEGKVMAALDAGRGDVYTGKYEIAAKAGAASNEQILTRSEFLAQAKGWTLVTPDSAIAEASIAENRSVSLLAPVSASDVARLGWRKILAGETVTSEQLEANYIRRTDAELLEKSRS
jgi:tRNA threonylcarbamoyladenosine biosynthesis protein TsaB